MNEDINDIYSLLTDEEKSFLKQIETKIAKGLESIKEHVFDHIDDNDTNNVPDFSKKHPEILHPKNLTKAPHEITINIKADVASIDSNGYLSEVVEILEKFYHIPVKAKDDYKIYLERFFQQFHQALESTCQELNPNKPVE